MDACGFSCWHPNWLTKFANTRCYMIIFGLLGTIQEIGATYLIVTLTTMEKRFRIPSQMTGLILAGNEISQISLALVLTYFGGQQNRPRWIAWSMVFSAMSCFILAWPHFIYGAGDDALQYTEEYGSKYENTSLTLQSKPIDQNNHDNKLCKATDKSPDEPIEVLSYLPLILIFISQFLLGIGNTLHGTLGQAYLDDNNKKKRKTPLMLSYAFAMRMIGPIIGYGFAYLIMTIYIDPSKTPTITQDDPRWLGAWWLGWIILGVITLLFAVLIGLFPKELPKRKKQNADEYKFGSGKICEQSAKISENMKIVDDDKNKDENVNLENFPKALRRLLGNKILMCRNFAAICYMLGSSGFSTFQGRIMEVQFDRSSHSGTIFMGPFSRLGMIMGVLLSGYVITKYKPPAKYLFLWNVIWGFTAVFIRFLYTQIGCDGGNLLLVNGSIVSCNSNCNCDDIPYSPVCDRSTNTTYFSACHAGCRTYDENTGFYRDCICTAAMMSEVELPHQINDEPNSNHQIMLPKSCIGGDCTTDYYIFSFVLMIAGFFSMTGSMSTVLVDLRSVEPRDKSFAGGFSMFISSLLALIPGPILFGRMIDSTCLVWSNKNGQRGNCQLYDPIKFRQRLHPYLAMFILFGTLFDLLVWHYGQSLELYEDQTNLESITRRKQEVGTESPENQPLRTEKPI